MINSRRKLVGVWIIQAGVSLHAAAVTLPCAILYSKAGAALWDQALGHTVCGEMLCSVY